MGFYIYNEIEIVIRQETLLMDICRCGLEVAVRLWLIYICKQDAGNARGRLLSLKGGFCFGMMEILGCGTKIMTVYISTWWK